MTIVEFVIARVRASGANISRLGQYLRVEHPERIDPDILEMLGKYKSVVLAQLEANELEQLIAEARASEWWVDHDTFVIAREAQAAGTFAACLACGGTWELHGRPPRAQWQIVDDIEAVELVAARFVLVRAQALLEPRPDKSALRSKDKPI